jgi:hypothetical protein
VLIARIFTAYYFAYFLIILPVLGRIEKTKPLPNSITESVLREGLPVGRFGAAHRRARRLEGNIMALQRTSRSRRLRSPRLPLRRWRRITTSRRRRRTSGRSPDRSASTIAGSCSAASRSIARSARSVTA